MAVGGAALERSGRAAPAFRPSGGKVRYIALRRALDVLVSEPHVDAARIAYVGHDFGAMYGALVVGSDPRPCAYVFMTPRSRFGSGTCWGEDSR